MSSKSLSPYIKLFCLILAQYTFFIYNEVDSGKCPLNIDNFVGLNTTILLFKSYKYIFLSACAGIYLTERLPTNIIPKVVCFATRDGVADIENTI